MIDSALFEVKEIDSRKGRGVTALADLPEGCSLLRTAADIANLYSANTHNHCHQCFAAKEYTLLTSSGGEGTTEVAVAQPTQGSGLCPNCRQFALCEKCSTEFKWNDHAQVCTWFCSLPKDTQAGDTDYLRFLLEYANRVQRGDTALMVACGKLCTNEDSQSAEVKQFCHGYSKLVATHFGTRGLLIDKDHMYRLLLQTKSNSIGFPFSESETLGWALEETVCMLNHSCKPNCALRQHEDGTMELMTVSPIAAGAELTISYVDRDRFPDVAQRTRHLLEQYRFLCQCELCIAERQK